MKLGFQMAAAVIALAGWAGSAEATTVTGSGTTNILGPIGIGDTLTVDTTTVAGIANGPYNGSQTYFDYIFTFDLTQPAEIDGAVFSSGGNNFDEFHVVLSDVDPKNTVLYFDHDPDMYKHFDNATPPNEIPNDNLIDIGKDTPFISAGSSNGNGVGVHLDSLAAGTYYLRLFGVSQTGSVGAFAGQLGANALAATTPVPPALLMFLTALGGLGLTGLVRRAAAA
ncbi:MAG TPA: hypothetical protein VHE77_07210 [Dongiaceae bacterium]|nr:hypothetical protein [Dongiaceae bacterium]